MRRLWIPLSILAIGFLIVFGSALSRKVALNPTQLNNNVSTSTTHSNTAVPRLLSIASSTVLTEVNLDKTLPVSYIYFNNPKTYANTYIGFAFDYEEKYLVPLEPEMLKEGNNEKAEMLPSGALFDKTSSPYLENGFVGVIKLNFNPANQKLSNNQDNVLFISIRACGPKPNCYTNDVLQSWNSEKEYFDSITDLSQVVGSKTSPGETPYEGVRYSWRRYSPNYQYDFYAKINTGSSIEDQNILQSLFKTRATFRTLEGK